MQTGCVAYANNDCHLHKSLTLVTARGHASCQAGKVKLFVVHSIGINSLCLISSARVGFIGEHLVRGEVKANQLLETIKFYFWNIDMQHF
jgi:hypothetical protein